MSSKEIDSKPPGRRAVAVRAVVAAVVGITLMQGFHHQVAGTIVVCIAAVFALGTMSPGLRRGLHRFEGILVHVVGSVLTVALLVPFFYLCMLPGRIILLLTGKDPMNRGLSPKNESYWVPMDRTSSREQYRRQS